MEVEAKWKIHIKRVEWRKREKQSLEDAERKLQETEKKLKEGRSYEGEREKRSKNKLVPPWHLGI